MRLDGWFHAIRVGTAPYGWGVPNIIFDTRCGGQINIFRIFSTAGLHFKPKPAFVPRVPEEADAQRRLECFSLSFSNSISYPFNHESDQSDMG